jgi:hypothetical protein
LASAIKWIAERTRDAVDRASVDELAAQQAVCELQDALALGEVRLTGSTALDPVPRLFPPETWATYQVCLLEEGGLLWPCILHDATEREDLLYVRLRRDEVLRRWPPHDSSEAGPPNSVSKETACRGWLTKMMRENSDKPRPKTQIRAEASNKFPGLGKNALDRAWATALQDSGATAWGPPGRRRKLNHLTSLIVPGIS